MKCKNVVRPDKLKKLKKKMKLRQLDILDVCEIRCGNTRDF